MFRQKFFVKKKIPPNNILHKKMLGKNSIQIFLSLFQALLFYLKKNQKHLIKIKLITKVFFINSIKTKFSVKKIVLKFSVT